MSARAVLSPRANSHPFQERSVSLDQPLKIGRSVARSRPGPNNGIFDCKVLSRNHALLWYEAGKFYLQDTKSSNGTFVNSVRLSKSSEESPPTQIMSGDVLQFGVDVMELTKKVTHGCIVAGLQLFTPDGKEAKGPAVTDKNPPTTLQDVYALNLFIREASEREEKLENKLVEMKGMLSSTTEALESGWRALIEEDRLLTRIDILERQLQACHKSTSDEKLREEVVELLSDKEKYQEAAKEALRKSMLEKMEATKKFTEIERNMKNSEDEKEFLRRRADESKDELEKLASRLEEAEKRGDDLSEELGVTSLKYKEEVESLSSRFRAEEELLRDKDTLIQNLLSRVNHNNTDSVHDSSGSPDWGAGDRADLTFQDPLGNHNQDTRQEDDPKEILPKTPTSALEKGDSNELNSELYDLRQKLRLVESDKAEVFSRLNYIQQLFVGLQTAARNSPETTESIRQAVSKVDDELRQVKNGLAFPDTPNYPPPIQSFITHQISPQRLSADGEENRKEESREDRSELLQKLLEEARETIQILKKENLSIATALETSSSRCESTLRQFEGQSAEFDRVSRLNYGLTKSQRELEQSLSRVLTASDQLRLDLEAQKGRTAETLATVNQLLHERSQLQQMVAENEGEVRVLRKNLEDLKELPQKVEENEELEQRNRVLEEYATEARLRRDRQRNLIQRMGEMEEELATYKDRYLSSASENSHMRRELAEVEQKRESQQKLVLVVVPLVVALVLAVMITFHPISSP